MPRDVTIVMYHYVRDPERSGYPGIKGLSTDEFTGQLAYVKRHYTVISGADLLGAVTGGDPLPPRALLLTFDDGYMDHYTEVLPRLAKEKLPGCFFPSARCVIEHRVLDVNKIHFVLATAPDAMSVATHIRRRIDESRDRYALADSASYWERLARRTRFDAAEIVFCKRALQRELPLELRAAIVDELFAEHVTRDEEAFARELYMSVEQIRELSHRGMHVGSHGYDHFWLDSIAPGEQEREIDESLKFLRLVGAGDHRWIMCYPYGAYDDSLLRILRSRDCAVGLTTAVRIADLDRDEPLTLPRLDTNDLPKRAGAEPCEWTLEVSPS